MSPSDRLNRALIEAVYCRLFLPDREEFDRIDLSLSRTGPDYLPARRRALYGSRGPDLPVTF